MERKVLISYPVINEYSILWNGVDVGSMFCTE